MNLFRKTGSLALTVSFLLLVALTIAYLGRWDTVAAATFLPFWTWTIAGLGLTFTGWFFVRARNVAPALFLLWLAVTLILADDVSRFVLSVFLKAASLSSAHNRYRLANRHMELRRSGCRRSRSYPGETGYRIFTRISS